MKHSRTSILVISFLCFTFHLPAHGQEMLGTTLGNFSGVNGTQLNPSSMLSSKLYVDIHLLSADVFLQSNFLYIDKKDYRISNFFKAGYELPVHPEQYGTELRNFYIFPNNYRRDAYIQLRINGPGAMLVYGKHAFALSTGIRSVVSAKGMPIEIANFSYLGLNYLPQQNINYKDNRSFRVGEMTWAEIGLSYAYQVYARGFDKITAGITLKRLFGYSALYLKVKSVDYIVPSDTSISVHNMNAQMGYSLPFDYDGGSGWNNSFNKGGGFGGDIGITYTRLTRLYSPDYFTSLCSQQNDDYLYRLGIALIDVGAIRFHTGAETYSIDNRSSYWDDVDRFHFRNFHQLMDTISYRFYGNSTESYRGNNFLMWLPAALSVQFDYHYFRNWYVNALLIYGFDLGPASVSRPAEIAVTPRYETHGFEAELPLSLYDWQQPRIGLALRFYYVTIGTEKLGQFFNISNLSGMDFYFSIHYGFEKGSCRNTRQKGCADIDYRIKSVYR